MKESIHSNLIPYKAKRTSFIPRTQTNTESKNIYDKQNTIREFYQLQEKATIQIQRAFRKHINPNVPI